MSGFVLARVLARCCRERRRDSVVAVERALLRFRVGIVWRGLMSVVARSSVRTVKWWTVTQTVVQRILSGEPKFAVCLLDP